MVCGVDGPLCPTQPDFYRSAQLRCHWTTNMEQITCNTPFARSHVTLVQAPSEELRLRATCFNTNLMLSAVLYHHPALLWLQSSANSAPFINNQTSFRGGINTHNRIGKSYSMSSSALVWTRTCRTYEHDLNNAHCSYTTLIVACGQRGDSSLRQRVRRQLDSL